MVKTEANGSDIQHQGSEKPQDAVCLACNKAKMMPRLKGELGGLPKDTRGMVCEGALQPGRIQRDAGKAQMHANPPKAHNDAASNGPAVGGDITEQGTKGHGKGLCRRALGKKNGGRANWSTDSKCAQRGAPHLPSTSMQALSRIAPTSG